MALTIDPNNVSLLGCKGEALRLSGQQKESIEWFDKALAIDPKNVYSLGCKGQSLNSIRKYKEAFDVFVQALQLNPGCRWILDEMKISKDKLNQ